MRTVIDIFQEGRVFTFKIPVGYLVKWLLMPDILHSDIYSFIIQYYVVHIMGSETNISDVRKFTICRIYMIGWWKLKLDRSECKTLGDTPRLPLILNVTVCGAFHFLLHNHWNEAIHMAYKTWDSVQPVWRNGCLHMKKCENCSKSG